MSNAVVVGAGSNGLAAAIQANNRASGECRIKFKLDVLLFETEASNACRHIRPSMHFSHISHS
ncbi:MAG: hypothetical protein QOH91_2255 [Mycobacterium sp.]|jgi:flavin-dependent dehydrogenase|nr:hypothetical protein [Mycobacterium sp.]